MNKVVLTGAGGLAGSHIAEYFVRKDVDLLCLVRSNKNIELLKKLGVKFRYVDIIQVDSLIESFNGADFIIHTAAKVSDWGKYDDFYKTNVIGMLNVLKAANYHGIKNIIITGSISCYGEESSPLIKDEEVKYNPHYKYFLDRIFPSGMNFYRDTKAEANNQAVKFAEDNFMNLTIIEPAWIYGEREFHSGFYDFLKTVKSGFHFVPGSKKNKFHTIYARDLAKIYYLAYEKKLKGINKILAVSPQAEYQYKLLNLLCEKAGFKIPNRIPKFIIYPPAFFIELFYTVFRFKNPPPVSRARVNIFYDNIEYSDKKLKKLLGFVPDYSFEQSIENTINWYKGNNYL
ncbi:MAG: NAD-dependent epimerase/dehydratase family protein [Bacteroidetes bacterium]|nr:NAD-dependent epimerase/dehydratase family protein [Bacteroidota bacterium]